MRQVLTLFYISEMPKYPKHYDWDDPDNSELMDALAHLRHLGVRAASANDPAG